jgi:hypothetical protein
MTGLKDYKPLHLLAEDAEDLKVISACFQDAVAKVGDFAYIPAQRRFAFVANRFVWETSGDRRAGPYFRTRSGAHFDDVKACKHLNIKTDAKDAVVELLAIRFEPLEEGAGSVVLDFAGGGAIRLEVDAVSAEMRDISGPWRTQSKPDHE